MIERADQLREAREAAGLSLGDVAQRLRLSARHLDAIEAGAWERLPGAAFTRGAVRSYARLLGVDVELLLRTLPAAQDPELLRPAPSLEASLPRTGSRRSIHLPRGGRLTSLWLFAGVLLALGIVALQWPQALQNVRESVRSRQAQSTVSVAVPKEAVPEGSHKAPAGSNPAPEIAQKAPDLRSEARPTAGGSDTPSGSARLSWPQALVLTSRQDSWVEIRDEAGLVIHMGLVRPKAPLRLELRAPVSYTIGNAAGTLLEFAGQPVDLASQTQPGTNIAKGSLP